MFETRFVKEILLCVKNCQEVYIILIYTAYCKHTCPAIIMIMAMMMMMVMIIL